MVTDVSADKTVERLRQSLSKVLGWAELHEPRLLQERAQYDADLDEAEDLLAATGSIDAAQGTVAATGAKDSVTGTGD